MAKSGGDPFPRERTWVLLTESPEGGWGIGHANTGADIAEAARRELTRQRAIVEPTTGHNERETFLMGEPKSAAGPHLLQRAAAEAEKLAVPVNDADHLSGPTDAVITLLEYGDYECFYCGAAENIVRVVQERLTSPLRLVFRHFPLTEVHEHAELAALAAEAAAAQGRFWQMHSWLFQHQRTLELGQMVQEAANLGLDVARFRADVEQRVFRARVDADLEGGLQSGVTGVPTFFINGVRHFGSYRPEGLIPALIAAGAEAK